MQVKYKGTKTFRHDLYKGDVKKYLRNVSYKKDAPDLVPIEHTHIYHTYDSRGKPQSFTSTTGGHFHEVSVGPDGVVKCGPPMRWGYKKGRDGNQVKRKEPLKWFDKYATDHAKEWIEDTHTHEFEYIHSEELSPNKIKDAQMQTQAAIAASMEAGHAGSIPTGALSDQALANARAAGISEKGGVIDTL